MAKKQNIRSFTVHITEELIANIGIAARMKGLKIGVFVRQLLEKATERISKGGNGQ